MRGKHNDMHDLCYKLKHEAGAASRFYLALMLRKRNVDNGWLKWQDHANALNSRKRQDHSVRKGCAFSYSTYIVLHLELTLTTKVFSHWLKPNPILGSSAFTPVRNVQINHT